MMNSDFWRKKKVLVTGHTGFKGGWLSLWLNELGCETFGYALRPPTNPSLFDEASLGEILAGSIADVCSLDDLSSAIDSAAPDIIIHMAAQSVVLDSYTNPVYTYATNVMGTVHLLESVRKTGVRCTIVNVTTDKVYENVGQDKGYEESDRLGGSDPYSNSKACSEFVTAAYRQSYFPVSEIDKHGVAIATARAGNVVGGGDWTPWQLIPDVMASFREGNKVTLRHPDAIRPWQHVLDCLSGYLTLANRLHSDPEGYSGEWNFGPATNDRYSVADVVETLARYWGIADGWELDDRSHSHEAATLSLDSSKAREQLQWQPKLTTGMALEWVANWYKSYFSSGFARELCRGQIEQYMAL